MDDPAYKQPDEDDYDHEDAGSALTRPELGKLESQARPSGVYDDNREREGLFGSNPLQGKPSAQGKVHGPAEGPVTPDYGPSMLDDMRGKLGVGASAGSDSSKSRLAKWYNSTSKTKRRLAIGGAFGGSGLAALFFGLFMLLIPLRIETMITNLDNRAGAASKQAIGTESTNLFERWVAKNIMPNLVKGACRSTVSAGCVTVAPGTGPVSRLYNGWREGKLEQRLAAKYDIVIGRQGNRIYINLPGENASITQSDAQRLINGETDLFTLAAENSRNRNHRVTANELRQHFASKLEEETKWNRLYDRYQLGKFMEQKYGIKRCVIACETRDKWDNKKIDTKLFANAVFTQRVIEPLGENYAFIFGCMIDPGNSNCNGDLENDASAGDTENQSRGERTVTENLTRYSAALSAADKAKAIEAVKAIDEKGLSRHLTEAMLEKLFVKAGSTTATQTSAKVAGFAVPGVDIVAAVIQVIQLEDAAQKIGPLVKSVGYAANAAAAVQTYNMFATLPAEVHSGNMSADQLGSFNTALNTNLTGAKEDRSDATQTPLYQYYNNTSNSSSKVASSGFSLTGTAYAATTTDTGSGYQCPDGKPVPSGQKVCDDEKLDRGNDFLNKVSGGMTAYLNTLPGGQEVVSDVSTALSKASSWGGDIFGAACTINPVCDSIARPLMEKLGDKIAALAEPIINYIISKVISSPITENMSGGRLYDMTAAGADVLFNSSCQVNLGCAAVSDLTAADIQNQYLAQQQKEFSNQPMFARMFSTDTPYSLVSRLAVAMPHSVSAGQSSLVGMISNPIGAFKNAASALGGSGSAFADTGSTADPFGVTQTAYTAEQIPKDPDTFWTNNCVNGPLAKYDEATDTLDISDWLNAQQADPDTGQAVAKVPNACLLIKQSVIVSGGLYDDSLIPDDYKTADPVTDTTSTGAGSKSFRIASYNIKVNSSNAWNIASTTNMKDNGFDIVGMQELENSATYNSITSKLYKLGYKTYPEPSKVGVVQRNGATGRTIAYNADRFELVKTDEISFRRNTEAYAEQPAKAPVIWLKDKESGQEIIVMNTHNPSDSTSGHTIAPRQRYDASLLYIKKIQELQAEGLPIFFTGDFNEGTGVRRDGGQNQTYNFDYHNLLYCMFASNNIMTDVQILADGGKQKCPNNSIGGVDYIYATSGVQVSKFGNLTGGRDKLGTDHNKIPYADVSIPGSGDDEATSADGETTKIKGVTNFRDAAATSGVLKSGTLYRSGQLDTITADGSKKLSALLGSNGTIIDLRTAQQRKDAPDASGLGVKTVNIPIDGVLDQAPMVTDPTRREQIGKALRAVASAKGPVLIHCSAGKDRTGWMVAMIMYVNGANDKQVMDEYMASAAAYPNGVKQDWLNSGLKAIHSQYGTITNYLKKGAGLSDADLSSLRGKFGD